MPRFFRHGELPLVVLALLDDKPMHSYGLLAELDRRFGDAYDPSTGTVYPAVSVLAAEKLIEPIGKEDRGAEYRLTALGSEVLEEKADMLTALEVRTGVRIRPNSDIESALARFAHSVRALSARLEPQLLDKELDKTVDRIKRLAQLKEAG